MSYASEVLADSPYFYFRQGEASGTTMTDASGNGRHGAYGHPDGFTAPTLGAAGLLTGDADTAATYTAGSHTGYYTTGNLNGQSAGTIEFWYKGTVTNIIAPKFLGRGDQFQVWQQAANSPVRGQAIVGGVTYQTPTGTSIPLNDNVAHHVVLTWDGSTLRMYVDGTERATAAAAGTFSVGDNKTRFHIGAAQDSGGYGGYVGGTFDEVAYYTTALSAARVAAHYTAGTTSSGLSGTTPATSAVVGSVTVKHVLSGVTAASSSVSGNVTVTGETLGGTVVAVSGVTGSIEETFVPFEPPRPDIGIKFAGSNRNDMALPVDVNDVTPIRKVAASVSEGA